MNHIKIEICCASADDAIEAFKAGADRVEFLSNLFQGGLTPTAGALRVVKKYAAIPAMCMVRPREGGFCYTEMEFETALADAKILVNNGADGIVFGFLKADGTVDANRCAAIIKAAGDREKVFHRAIDVTPDWRTALDILIKLGVTRVLTSGQRRSAHSGAPVIAEMIRYAAGRVEIMPGAGVTPDNAVEIVEKTGCSQIHMSMHKIRSDSSTHANPDIRFGETLCPPEDQFKVIDGDRLTRFTNFMKNHA
jgi:copper homeostasis protein